MDHQYPTVAKIPVLDTGKFEQWQFQIQQYLQHEHYALWEVIEFDDYYKVPTNTDPDNTTMRKDDEQVEIIRSKWSASCDCQRQKDLYASRKRLSSQKRRRIKFRGGLLGIKCTRHSHCQNFRVVHKSSISSDTSQISSIHPIAPILSTKEPEHLLSMGYEHLSITPEIESDEVTEFNVENLLPIPSKCEVTLEDEIECDIPAKDVCSLVFTTFSNPLFNNDDLDSINDESLFDEDVPAEEFKIYSNPLLVEDEINSDKLDPHYFNVESDFVESLLNRDTFIDSSSKFDFSGELAHVKPKIPKSDFDFEEEIRLFENLLYKNSSPRPPEELNAEIADTIVEYIPLLPIPVQDEEVDLFLSDDSLPPGIENIADDPKRDICFLEELLIDDSILSHESFDSNFENNPSIPRSPPEPPDAETDAGEETLVVMNDKDKFDEDFHFFIFDKVFALLSAESEDTIFDLGFYPPVIEAFLCWIFVRFPRSSHPLIDSSLGKSISFDLYCLAVIFSPLCSNYKH
nr:hypothetical protein [Tanacetum cinerariifolium]